MLDDYSMWFVFLLYVTGNSSGTYDVAISLGVRSPFYLVLVVVQVLSFSFEEKGWLFRCIQAASRMIKQCSVLFTSFQ